MLLDKLLCRLRELSDRERTFVVSFYGQCGCKKCEYTSEGKKYFLHTVLFLMVYTLTIYIIHLICFSIAKF